MRLFRRGMRSGQPRNLELSPAFMAEVVTLLQKNTREQNAALVRAIKDAEAAITKQLEAIMATLEETLAAVQAEKTSEDSLVALVVGMKKQLDAALAGALTPSQQMRVDAIFNQITTNKAAVDAAVTANTEGGPAQGNLAPTSVTITSSLNPANVGDTISLSAGLTFPAGGPAAPTGTMTFFDGSTALGTASMDSTGVAALSSSTFAGGGLAAGDHSLHATYSGDSVYAASDSADLDQTIGVPTATVAGGSSATPPGTPAAASAATVDPALSIDPSKAGNPGVNTGIPSPNPASAPTT